LALRELTLSNKDFKSIVQNILAKHNIALLDEMWEQAISLEPEVNIIDYWIRDSNDVIDIVWLTPLDIRGITWFPVPAQSVFNYVPLRNILSFEVRRLENVAHYYGYNVRGNLLITAFCQAQPSNLRWVADTKKQTNELERFFLSVLATYHNLAR
jgi:hypothetical protein